MKRGVEIVVVSAIIFLVIIMLVSHGYCIFAWDTYACQLCSRGYYLDVNLECIERHTT